MYLARAEWGVRKMVSIGSFERQLRTVSWDNFALSWGFQLAAQVLAPLDHHPTLLHLPPWPHASVLMPCQASSAQMQKMLEHEDLHHQKDLSPLPLLVDGAEIPPPEHRMLWGSPSKRVPVRASAVLIGFEALGDAVEAPTTWATTHLVFLCG